MEDKIIRKIIPKEEHFFDNSNKISIEPNQQYRIITNIIPIKGKPYSAWFGVLLLDSNDKEISRPMRWIDSFDGNEKKISFIFTTNPNARIAVITFRVNLATPIRSDVEVQFQKSASLNLEKVKDLENSFQNINDFKVPNFPPLTSSEEHILEKKIVWVFCSDRSGSTWLAKDLLNHSENILWNEPKIVHSFEISKNILGLETGTPLIKKPFERDLARPNYFFSEQYKSNWIDYLKKLLLHRAFSFSQTIKKNLIIKEPSGGEGIRTILECLPNSKMIFLVRDGRDVVDSKVDRHMPDSWSIRQGSEFLPLDTLEKRRRIISYYSSDWKWTIINIQKDFEKHDSTLRYFLRYEDLIKNTFFELKKIYDFLKMPIDENEIRHAIEKSKFENIPSSEKGPGKFYRTAKVGGYKDNFSKEEQELMNSIMGETLKKMNYEI